MRVVFENFQLTFQGFAKERIRKAELSTLHKRSKTIFSIC